MAEEPATSLDVSSANGKEGAPAAAEAEGHSEGDGGKSSAGGDEGERSEFAISSRPITLKCRLQFASDVPLSFSRQIRFEDGIGNSAELTVTATADNSLFTCYPFIAKHRENFRIVCEQVSSLLLLLLWFCVGGCVRFVLG